MCMFRGERRTIRGLAKREEAAVLEPIVFISHSRVKAERLEPLRELSREAFQTLEETKPRTVLHHGFVSGDGSEVSFIHVFPDADAMDAHFVGAGDRAGSAADYVETYQFEVYGRPSGQALSVLEHTPGVELVVHPDGLGGYTRLG